MAISRETLITLLQGVESNRTSDTPQQGEPLYTTDESKLFVGDGSTAGGIQVGGHGNYAWGHSAGNKYCSAHKFTGSAASAIIANFVLYVPVCVARPTTFTGIGQEIAVAGSGNARLGIYECLSDGKPGSLILDAGTVGVGTTGVKTASISQSLTGGWYWLATQYQTTAGSMMGLASTVAHPGEGMPTAISDANVYNGWAQIRSYASGFSDPAGTLIHFNGSLPSLFLSL
jgi:hypothetical protein